MTKDSEREIGKLERYLKANFPSSYRRFLRERGTAIIGGHKILGFTVSSNEMSVVEATEILRRIRSDLPQTYIAISFKDDLCLCFNAVEQVNDPRLIEVAMEQGGKVLTLPLTFSQYIEYFEKRKSSYKVALQRIKNRKREFETTAPDKIRRLKRLDFEGNEPEQTGDRKEQTTLHSRAQDWHPRLFRLLDMVVAMSCFCYNFSLGCLEVDVFWAPNDARCEPDDMIKWLAASIFADALNLSGSANIIFTRDRWEDDQGLIPQSLREKKPQRIPIPLPGELVDYAQRQGVMFSQASQGRITHTEAVALWWKIVGLSDKAGEKVRELEEAGWLSRDWLCYVLTQGVWSCEEADWILQNAPRPEAVLLATDPPEYRLPHAETLAWARAALITARFVRKVVLDFTGGYAPEDDVPTPEYTLETDGPFQILRFENPYLLPWLHRRHREQLQVKAREAVLLLCRPRYPLRCEWDTEWLSGELALIASHKGDFAFRCLILSMEFGDCPAIEDSIQKAAEVGVNILFGQRRLDMYEDDVMERMHRVRVQRRFASRIAPMKIRALEVPGKLWSDKEIGLDMMSRTAETFGRWIGKQRQVKRARFDFITHSESVERITVEQKESRDLGELTAQESEKIQHALFPRDKNFPDVSFSYIKPDKIKTFLATLPASLRERLKVKQTSGLVFIHSAYEKVQGKTSRTSTELQVATGADVLPAEFQLPDPDEKAISWWRYDDVQIFRDRLEESLRTGHPLAISFLRLSLFADIIRPCLWYEALKRSEITERNVSKYPLLNWLFRLLGKIPPQKLVKKTQVFHERRPAKAVGLRIVYQDGSEGEPFLLFDLPPIERPLGLLKLNLGTVSMRHSSTDFVVAAYLTINLEVQFRKESGASEQEAFAFHRTLTFVGNLLQAAKGENLEAISKVDSVYSVLLEHYKIGQPPAHGLELHLFQATGLEPVTIGVYRALRELIKQHRGELVVVPRVLVGRPVSLDPNLEGEAKQKAMEETYKAGQPWY